MTADHTPAPSLAGRRVVLGVTGGIAAYKAIEVCRRLVDAGAHVAPVLTDGALRFVGETTFSALASEPAVTSLFGGTDPIPHTRLGQGADVVVVVPATARLLADYATGRSDDLLTATLLATRAPVVVCPAMHTEMWEHPAVQENLATLAGVGASRRAARGGPPGRRRRRRRPPGRPGRHRRRGGRRALAAGDLAGRRGAGHRRRHPGAHRPRAGHHQPLVGQAGLRPGRRGRGPRRHASPWSPPSTVRRPRACAEVVQVESAADMQAAVVPRAPAIDVVVMAAAVADFRPVDPADRKLKKASGAPGHRARAHPRLPRRPGPRTSRPARCWSASPPRPTTCGPTPGASSSARASTSSSPTT